MLKIWRQVVRGFKETHTCCLNSFKTSCCILKGITERMLQYGRASSVLEQDNIYFTYMVASLGCSVSSLSLWDSEFKCVRLILAYTFQLMGWIGSRYLCCLINYILASVLNCIIPGCIYTSVTPSSLSHPQAVTLPLSLGDGKWHHVCVTWSTRDGQWEAYQDGVQRGSGINLSPWHPIKPGGVFILGQEQVQTMTFILCRLQMQTNFTV